MKALDNVRCHHYFETLNITSRNLNIIGLCTAKRITSPHNLHPEPILYGQRTHPDRTSLAKRNLNVG